MCLNVVDSWRWSLWLFLFRYWTFEVMAPWIEKSQILHLKWEKGVSPSCLGNAAGEMAEIVAVVGWVNLVWMGSAHLCVRKGRNGVSPFPSQQESSGGTSWFSGGYRLRFSWEVFTTALEWVGNGEHCKLMILHDGKWVGKMWWMLVLEDFSFLTAFSETDVLGLRR